MTSFDELVSQLQEGDIVNFKEFSLDGREKKRLTLSVEGAIIKEVIPANFTLNRDKLIEIYGEELDDIDYLALATSNCPRYLLNLGLSEDNSTMNVKMITLNRDFYVTQLQILELVGKTNLDEPNYTMAQRGW